MKILIAVALGVSAASCVGDAPVTNDAPKSDAPLGDAAVTVDATLGDPSLARAPRTCTTPSNDTAIAAQFGPVWKPHRYVPMGTADIQEHNLCTGAAGPVLGVISKYTGAVVPPAQAPSVGIARVNPLLPPFSLSYVVESIDQTGETENGFAGVLVLSLQAPNYGALAINRRPSDGQYFMLAQTQAGAGTATPLGALTPPFRVKLDASWSNGVLSIGTTITTATAKTQMTSVVVAPNQMMTLTLGVNRAPATGASKIVYSELVLP
jgi:hypothetical protein